MEQGDNQCGRDRTVEFQDEHNLMTTWLNRDHRNRTQCLIIVWLLTGDYQVSIIRQNPAFKDWFDKYHPSPDIFGTLFNWLFKPNANLQKSIDAQSVHLDLFKVRIGMHIRLGRWDYWNRNGFPLNDFCDLAKSLAFKYRTEDANEIVIFISSDSKDVRIPFYRPYVLTINREWFLP
jgi:hypothetical protein